MIVQVKTRQGIEWLDSDRITRLQPFSLSRPDVSGINIFMDDWNTIMVEGETVESFASIIGWADRYYNKV